MSGKIIINRLNQCQLNYLLTIRGLPTSTVDKMRASLSRAMKLEKEGNSISYPSYPFTFKEDSEAINEVILKVEQSLSEKQSLTPKSKRFTVNQTRLGYAIIRLDHISPTNPEEEAYKKDTFAKILVLLDVLENKTDVPAASSSPKTLFQANTSESDDDESLSGQESASTPFRLTSGQVPTVGSIIKSVPVFRWGLKFSGDRKGLSVQAFLQRGCQVGSVEIGG